MGEPTRLLHLSDTHLGYAPYGSARREQDFTDAFVESLDIALETGVAAVVHTGDVTHHHDPGESLPDRARAALERLADAEVPFYCIVGNHDLTDAGRPQPWLTAAVDSGLCQRLGREPRRVGDVALYGVDYHDNDWWADADGPTFADPPAGTAPVVCLHQSVAPVAPGTGTLDLAALLDRVRFPVAAVLLGHSHYTQQAEVAGVPAMYAGSTERTSRGYRDEPTVVTELRVSQSGLERVTHDLGTRPFGNYTVVLGDAGRGDLRSAAAALEVEDEVVTCFRVGSSLDTAAVADAFETAGALDAACYDADEQPPLDPGVYAGAPADLAALDAADLADGERPAQVSFEDGDRAAPAGLPGTQATAATDGRGAGESATVLHVGSVHMSSSNVTSNRRVEFREAFESAVDIACERGVDAFVQTGELFATRSPADREVDALTESLERLERAGVAVVHAGVERDADMAIVDRFADQGLLHRPGTDPVVVGDTAFYTVPPLDRRGVLDHLGDLAPLPGDADRGVVAAARTVSPPADGGDIQLEDVIDALATDVDTLLLGGSRNRQFRSWTTGEGLAVHVAGPTELELRKRVLRQELNYPCKVGTLQSDGTYETTPLSHRPVAVYHVDCAPDADRERVQSAVDPHGTTVMVGLRGEYSAGDSFPAEELAEWLEERTDVFKVWDDRDRLPEDPSVDTGGTTRVSLHYARDPTTAEEGGSTTGPPETGGTEDAAEPDTGESPEPSTAGAGESAEAGRSATAGATETTDTETAGAQADRSATPDETASTDGTSGGGVGSDGIMSVQGGDSGAGLVEPRDDLSDLVPEPLVEGAGTNLDPETHLSGADLEAAGYATVEPTDGGRCGYRLDTDALAVETDQRVTIRPDDGVWACPHAATDGDRCVFHSHDADAADVRAAFEACLLEADRPREFVGASVPALVFENQDLGDGGFDPVDLRLARVDGDLALRECRVASALLLDGMRVDGEFRVDGGGVGSELSAREAWFRGDVVIKRTTLDRRPYFYGSFFEGKLSFADATLHTGVSLGNTTCLADVVFRRTQVEGPLGAYDVDVGGLFDCKDGVFERPIQVRDASLRGDLRLADARCRMEVDVQGSVFDADATLDCQSAHVADDLRLERSELGAVDWRRVDIEGSVVCRRTDVERDVTAAGATLAGGVGLPTGVDRTDDETPALTVTGDVVLEGATVDTTLALEWEVGGAVRGERFDAACPVDLAGTAGAVDFSRAVFDDDVRLSLQVDGSVEWTRCTANSDVSVAGSTVAGDLGFANAAIAGNLDAGGVTVEGDAVTLSEARVTDAVRLDRATCPAIRADDATFEGAVSARELTCDEFDASRMTVEGRFVGTGLDVAATLSLAGATVHESVSVLPSEQDRDVAASVGTVDATDAVFEESVAVTSAVDTLRLDEARVVRDVDLADLAAATVCARDLTVAGDLAATEAAVDEFRLDRARVEGTLDCTDTAVDALSLPDAQVGKALFVRTASDGSSDGDDSPADAQTDEAPAETSGAPSAELTVDARRTTLADGRVVVPSAPVHYDLTDATLGDVAFESAAGRDEDSVLRRFRLYRTDYDGFRFDAIPGLDAAGHRLHGFDGTPAGENPAAVTPSGLETTYRRAKNGAAQVGNTTAEGEFFVAEMRQRKARYREQGDTYAVLRNRFFEQVAGYGERPWQVVKASGAGILLFAALFPVVQAVALLAGGTAPGTVLDRLVSGSLLPGLYGSPPGWLLLSFESFTTLVLGGTSVSVLPLRVLAAFEGFVGAFLIALFLFTLTKTIDR